MYNEKLYKDELSRRLLCIRDKNLLFDDWQLSIELAIRLL